jgi:hypothetical protein
MTTSRGLVVMCYGAARGRAVPALTLPPALCDFGWELKIGAGSLLGGGAKLPVRRCSWGDGGTGVMNCAALGRPRLRDNQPGKHAVGATA